MRCRIDGAEHPIFEGTDRMETLPARSPLEGGSQDEGLSAEDGLNRRHPKSQNKFYVVNREETAGHKDSQNDCQIFRISNCDSYQKVSRLGLSILVLALTSQVISSIVAIVGIQIFWRQSRLAYARSGQSKYGDHGGHAVSPEDHQEDPRLFPRGAQ